jgi:ferrous iron transport protein B
MKINVALAGNPNVGKTSLLNHVAGTTLRVGNWAGTTIEKKEGKAFYKGYEIYLVDLPGIYSLEPFSEAEQAARDYLLNQKPDVVVNVLETPNMERDLLLTAELLEMESFGRVFAFKVFIRGGCRWCGLCAYLFAPDRKHSFYPFPA